MYVQMQEMDGLEATAAIRQYEQQSLSPRPPIIAMTAHAMAGDSYVAKPIQMQELRRALAEGTNSEKRATSGIEPTDPSPLPFPVMVISAVTLQVRLTSSSDLVSFRI